jgi:integrase
MPNQGDRYPDAIELQTRLIEAVKDVPVEEALAAVSEVLVFRLAAKSPEPVATLRGLVALMESRALKLQSLTFCRIRGLSGPRGRPRACATLLLSAGEPVHNVAARLGHKDATMTLKVYAHARS